ncbi:MAG: hypothetical protein CMI01_06240 [Oceanospirillaceae bacterium]|nr:hypothetical protein [Oceanospirillaceae bacterium]
MKKNKIFTGVGTVLAIGLYNAPTYAFELPDKFEGKFYGQLNQVVMFANDGDKSESFIADSYNSASRVGVKGSAGVGNGVSVGLKIEAAWHRNNSSGLNMDTRNISGDLAERHFDFFVKGGFGKVSVGMGDGAANGNTEVDLSGTLLPAFTSPAALIGGFQFQDKGVYGPAVKRVLNHQDFESRNDRLRYDTPAFAGTTLSVSSGVKSSNDIFELGLDSAQELGNGKLNFSLGYSAEDKGGAADTESIFGGSLSYLAGNGFNVTVSASTLSNDDSSDPDSDYRALKLGYKTGKHSTAVIFGRGSDQNMKGDDADYLSLGYTYKAAKWAEVYASYNRASLDRSGSDFDDINVLAMGGRIKF